MTDVSDYRRQEDGVDVTAPRQAVHGARASSRSS